MKKSDPSSIAAVRRNCTDEQPSSMLIPGSPLAGPIQTLPDPGTFSPMNTSTPIPTDSLRHTSGLAAVTSASGTYTNSTSQISSESNAAINNSAAISTTADAYGAPSFLPSYTPPVVTSDAAAGSAESSGSTKTNTALGNGGGSTPVSAPFGNTSTVEFQTQADTRLVSTDNASTFLSSMNLATTTQNAAASNRSTNTTPIVSNSDSVIRSGEGVPPQTSQLTSSLESLSNDTSTATSTIESTLIAATLTVPISVRTITGTQIFTDTSNVIGSSTEILTDSTTTLSVDPTDFVTRAHGPQLTNSVDITSEVSASDAAASQLIISGSTSSVCEQSLSCQTYGTETSYSTLRSSVSETSVAAATAQNTSSSEAIQQSDSSLVSTQSLPDGSWTTLETSITRADPASAEESLTLLPTCTNRLPGPAEQFGGHGVSADLPINEEVREKIF